MLVRVTGGSEGIAEYLETGQKADREFTRNELDERVILDGDLGLTDTIIKGMDKEGERYLHVTLAFKEDALGRDVMHNLTCDFKQFAMSAFEADEFNFYAEAHLPKLKSYTHRLTGELVERKPHIHIVIPEQNLLTGKNLNPFGRVEQQTKFLEAFQEHANAKYGLASPKDNRRTKFTSESEIISRYKGDMFHGSTKELKEQILSDVLERNIADYGSFKAMLNEYGETRVRKEGGVTEYQNIKPVGQAKGVNLKDYVFSREFIEKPEVEKSRFLAEEGRRQYESQQPPRKTAPELAAALQEWYEIRARELKYINSGNRKLYAAYRGADGETKRMMLDERAATFYAKHRKEIDNELIGKQYQDFRARENSPDRGTSQHRTVAHIAHNLRAAGCNIQSTGRAVGDAEQARRNLADRRIGRAVAALGQRLGCHQSEDRQVSCVPSLPRDRRNADNETGQLAADQREHKSEAKAAQLSEFAQIRRELDARRLLAHLSKTHGVIPEKYEVTKGKDGGDRIRAGSRNLNVSDFLTQEMRLSFTEAAPILRQVYAAQQGRDLAEAASAPCRELWQAFRQAQPERAKQKAAEWDSQRKSERERRAAIRANYQAERRAIQSDRMCNSVERKAALSLASVGKAARDVELRKQINTERDALRARHRIKPAEQYRAFLAERAEQGDIEALAELRRQRVQPVHPQGGEQHLPGIKGPRADRYEEIRLLSFASMTHQVNRQTGDVSYLLAGRAAFTDYGKRITFDGQASNDEAAILAGLQVAQTKFGRTLELTGSDEFKRRVAEVAAKNGLRVNFTDPSEAIFAGAKISQQRSGSQQTQPERAETAEEISSYEADELARQLIGPELKLRKLSAGAVARGKIVGETAHHVVQRISRETAVIHEKRDFAHLQAALRPQVGQNLAISVAGNRLKVAPIKSAERDNGHGR